LGNVLWNRDSIKEIVNNQVTNFYYDSILIGGHLTKKEGQDWLDIGGPTVQNIPKDKEKKNIKLSTHSIFMGRNTRNRSTINIRFVLF